jgi:hypothetical protein
MVCFQSEDEKYFVEKLTKSVTLGNILKTGKTTTFPNPVFSLSLLGLKKKPQDLRPKPIAATIYWGNMAQVADSTSKQHGNTMLVFTSGDVRAKNRKI